MASTASVRGVVLVRRNYVPVPSFDPNAVGRLRDLPSGSPRQDLRQETRVRSIHVLHEDHGKWRLARDLARQARKRFESPRRGADASN
jgi:hypothetical protein